MNTYQQEEGGDLQEEEKLEYRGCHAFMLYVVYVCCENMCVLNENLYS